jgi:hypothetical protein
VPAEEAKRNERAGRRYSTETAVIARLNSLPFAYFLAELHLDTGECELPRIFEEACAYQWRMGSA